MKRLRELEVENAKLKRMYADLALEKRGHQGCPEPKAITWSATSSFRARTTRRLGSGRPSAVRVGNGPEFTAQPFVDWCAEHGVATHYIQPGKPDQNAYIERFNRSYRTEVLNAHLFESIAELRAFTATWLRIYNGERHVSPEAFISGKVSYRTVRLTGELTNPLAMPYCARRGNCQRQTAAAVGNLPRGTRPRPSPSGHISADGDTDDEDDDA